MRKIYIFVAFMVSIAGPADAQTQTRCTTFGNTTNCTTQQPPPPIDYGAALRSGAFVIPDSDAADAQARLARAQAARIEAETDLIRRPAERRQRYGKLIAKGKCGQALQESLTDGELEAHSAIKGICEAESQPKK